MRHQNRTRMDIGMQILYLRWDPTNASFICCIMVLFSIMNVYLFLKCVTSDPISLSSLWCNMLSVCYLLCNNMHSYRSGKWHRKCKQLGTRSVFCRNV